MSRYIVGIDLGTTNCALASVDLSVAKPGDDEAKPPEVESVPIQQLIAPGQVAERATLPSFLYAPAAGELPAGSLDLPWANERGYMVGTAARDRGAQVPLRMVSSAKSWLCHARVDRRSGLLPFGAPPETEKISPITASTRYLEHLRDGWNHAHPGEQLEDQTVYLTVPASFDAAARELTVEAAHAASLSHVVLLEEPQAAFYAWLSRVGDRWRKLLRPSDRVLVCDVGGGTTDFSLIEVSDREGNLSLERVAVGDHILLGGDNMDLALAHFIGERLKSEGHKLDAGQQRALISAARGAKEKLLSEGGGEEAGVNILGRGSKLIGAKISTTLAKTDVERIIVEGFFPRCGKDARPVTSRRTGFMELGLEFAVEAAVTKHLAGFLMRHSDGKPVTHILFNGGVFNSPGLRARLVEVMGSWSSAPPVVLEDADHDLAVARGAAYYGGTKLGRGIRIRGGTARSYYVGIETAMPSVPGVRPPIRALCVVPFGMEEGTAASVPSQELGLVVGEPVEFRFLSCSTRKKDQLGEVLDEYSWAEHLNETAPLVATLEAGEGFPPGTLVPVRLEVKLTEIGTVEVWSAHVGGQKRWKLEFNVREQAEA
ncbi:MAG: Hsp70 family protein [Deltaproteobacteria bacterium]|nr:Hsp70 family protein [Deltaproteobacteria bacterium]